VPEIIVTDGVRGRIADLGMRRRDVWVVAAFVVVAVAGALLLWTRGRAPVVAPPAVQSSVPRDAPTPSSPALFVHVAGSVRRPGLYELTGGARVADALDAASGPLRKADLDLINLAQPVTDGMQVFVPRRGEGSTTPAATDAMGVPQETTVNLNTADQAALETIPGIGPVKGAAIIEYRESAGAFESVDDLLKVSGIGPATLESIRPYVSV
jgi:competence protein ComEA